jgi:hypothetical protein
MYCPKCSQQQVSDEVRFCSRCGFQLVAVSELLRTDGVAFFQTKKKLPLIKRPELRKSAKQIFLSLCLLAISFPIMGIIDPYFPFLSPFIIAVPFITFLFSIVQMFYYVFFGEGIFPIKTQSRSFAFSENRHQLNYQPAQSLPFETNPFNTAEFVQPPSITERTTNLIKNKKREADRDN